MNQRNRNPFEIMRKPGVCGSVVSSGYKTETVFASGNAATLQIRTHELIPGVWGFGFYLQIEGFKREMFPGEGSGWFLSQKDATLYALGYIRYGGVKLPEDMTFAIDCAISKLRNVPLFEL